MNKVIYIGIFLIAVAAIVVIGTTITKSPQASSQIERNCGSPSVNCVFDSGDSWIDVLMVTGKMSVSQNISARNISSEGIFIGLGSRGFSASRDYVKIDVLGGVNVNAGIPNDAKIYITNLPNVTGNNTNIYYLCINNINSRIYKSINPCR